MPNNGGFKSIFFGSTAIFGYTLQLKGKKKKNYFIHVFTLI